MSDSVTGSCFCGAVQFSVDMPTLFNAHCHCTMCQRVHGAAYITWIGVPETQLHVTAGADKLRHFASSDHGQRSFCTLCSSSLFCRSTRHPERVARLIPLLAENVVPLDEEAFRQTPTQFHL